MDRFPSSNNTAFYIFYLFIPILYISILSLSIDTLLWRPVYHYSANYEKIFFKSSDKFVSSSCVIIDLLLLFNIIIFMKINGVNMISIMVLLNFVSTLPVIGKPCFIAKFNDLIMNSAIHKFIKLAQSSEDGLNILRFYCWVYVCTLRNDYDVNRHIRLLQKWMKLSEEEKFHELQSLIFESPIKYKSYQITLILLFIWLFGSQLPHTIIQGILVALDFSVVSVLPIGVVILLTICICSCILVKIDSKKYPFLFIVVAYKYGGSSNSEMLAFNLDRTYVVYCMFVEIQKHFGPDISSIIMLYIANHIRYNAQNDEQKRDRYPWQPQWWMHYDCRYCLSLRGRNYDKNKPNFGCSTRFQFEPFSHLWQN